MISYIRNIYGKKPAEIPAIPPPEPKITRVELSEAASLEVAKLYDMAFRQTNLSAAAELSLWQFVKMRLGDSWIDGADISIDARSSKTRYSIVFTERNTESKETA